MDKKIEDVEFVIFDTETTGLDSVNGDRIVEIAAMKIKAGEQLGQFHSLVNSGRSISLRAFEVNQISSDMLKNAPDPRDVLPGFLDFIQGSCLSSYNLPFDLGFLNNELKLAGFEALENFILLDILTMSRKLLPNLERHALWFVAQNLGIASEQEHRAFADVELAWAVFERLRIMLKEKGVDKLSSFLNLFSIKGEFLNDINAQKAAKIEEAIKLGVKLKIKYFSRSSTAVSDREVIPKEIKIEQKQVYLVGICSLRKEERTFRVDNILDLEII